MQISKKGFTLIELMIAIAVIAIMAIAAFVIYGQVQVKARDSKRTQDIESIQKALEQYYITNSRYPVTTSNDSITTVTAIEDYFAGNSIPTDPLNGYIYHYRGGTCGSSTKYFVCAEMEKCSVSGNCNRYANITTSTPADACSSPLDTGTTLKYYCVVSAN